MLVPDTTTWRQTYVDILGQELVRYAVFVDDIVVHAGAGSRRSGEETEQSVQKH
jgi:hypothetical protein